MGKKNDFVITVGFNRNDADHVKAVEILNRLGRTKAHYIARAVLAYEGIIIRKSGGTGMEDPVDYSRIRKIIEEAVGQYKVGLESVRLPGQADGGEEVEIDGQQIGREEKGNIMASLKAFRGSGS